MKLWEWHTLNKKQFGWVIILSTILCTGGILLIDLVYGYVFNGIIPTLIYILFSFLIFYQVSPIIVKRVIK